MLSQINTLWSFAFFRFILTGILNTIFGYGVFIAFLYFGLQYKIALLLSTTIGVMFNYFSFARLTFSAKINWISFARFVVAYVIIYLVNLEVLIWLMDFAKIGPYLGQLICLPINILISWMILNKWVHKRDMMCQEN